MSQDFEARIGAVQEEFKRSGFADDLVGKLIVTGLFPQLRKRAKRDPAGMRRGIASVFAQLIGLLGLEPHEVFPPDRLQASRSRAELPAGESIERGSALDALVEQSPRGNGTAGAT